jgi:hypothetical protein
MKIQNLNDTNGFAVFSIGFDSRTGHHEKSLLLLQKAFFIFLMRAGREKGSLAAGKAKAVRWTVI